MRETYKELLYNVTGQTLELDVPEGRPSSVTSVIVYRSQGDDEGQTEPATTGSPAIEAIDTTLSAAAGPSQSDPTSISVTSGTGITKGRTYLLTAAGGEREWIDAIDVQGTTIISRVPLMNDFATGATFQSTRISVTIDSTWIADKSKLTGELGLVWRNNPPGDEDEEPWWRAAFVYVVNSKTYKRDIRFDVVRYTSGHLVTPIDVDRDTPGWLDRIPVDYRRDQGQSLIDEAWRAFRMDLLADGETVRWLRRPDVVTELLIKRAVWKAREIAAINGSVNDAEALKVAKDAYRERYNQIIREPHVRRGSSVNGGIIGGRRREPAWRK